MREFLAETDELIDCAQICHDYDQCVDTDLDVSDCTATCETRSDEDEAYRRKANACEACIDDKACLVATANVGDGLRIAVAAGLLAIGAVGGATLGVVKKPRSL